MSLEEYLGLYASNFKVGDTVKDMLTGKVGTVMELLTNMRDKSRSYAVAFPDVNSKPLHRFGNQIVEYAEPNEILKELV